MCDRDVCITVADKYVQCQEENITYKGRGREEFYHGNQYKLNQLHVFGTALPFHNNNKRL